MRSRLPVVLATSFLAISIALVALFVTTDVVGGVSSGLLARIEQQLGEREYWASPQHDGLQAPNRLHNFQTYFEPTGVRVHDRTAEGSPRLVELRLARLGRGDALADVSAGVRVSSHEDRVEIQRPGLVEWYQNGPDGLEQGFDLAERPAAALKGELVLELSLAGARASLQGDVVAMTTDAGRELEYGKLVVADATGRSLVARFDVPAPDRLQLLVDDSGAAYPIVIDPLLDGIPNRLVEAPLTSVASLGDINGDGFDDVIVGAAFYGHGQPGEGGAFVYNGSALGIAPGFPHVTPQEADAQLEGNTVGQFGWSVASAGDVNGDDIPDVLISAVWSGKVFIYHGTGTGSGITGDGGDPSTADAELTGVGGHSVASAGDVNCDGYDDVIVGSPTHSNGQEYEGAAFVFLGSENGIGDHNWSQAHAMLESNWTHAQLGTSVASAGDINNDGCDDVIVGAPTYDSTPIPTAANHGAVFIFLGSPSGIVGRNPANAHARIKGGTTLAYLGVSVAPAGNVNGDLYDDVIIGAPYDGENYASGSNPNLWEGRAYVFHGTASGIASGTTALANGRLESNQQSAYFGGHVASAGDVDGNGYDDVIVGAYKYDAGQTDEGAAFVFLGSASGVGNKHPGTAYTQLDPDQANANLGSAVASAGDINGDDVPDVIVAAPGFDQGPASTGAAFVYHGD